MHALALAMGLVWGSFCNVVIHRLPTRKSVVTPPSNCPACRKRIRWYDNLPLVSYLVLGGKCRACKAKISLRYPLVEAATGLLFLAAMIKSGPGPLLYFREWPLMVILICVTFIDLQHRIIPDELSLGGLVLGLVTAPLAPLGLQQALIGAAVGFGVFYGFAWIYERLTGRMGLGGGDVKLLAMLGAFLGFQGVFMTILVSSVLGTLVGIAWALAKGKKDVMKVAIPYGPFLVIGALTDHLMGEQLWSLFTIPT